MAAILLHVSVELRCLFLVMLSGRKIEYTQRGKSQDRTTLGMKMLFPANYQEYGTLSSRTQETEMAEQRRSQPLFNHGPICPPSTLGLQISMQLTT